VKVVAAAGRGLCCLSNRVSSRNHPETDQLSADALGRRREPNLFGSLKLLAMSIDDVG
jgi:hypothetical protein